MEVRRAQTEPIETPESTPVGEQQPQAQTPDQIAKTILSSKNPIGEYIKYGAANPTGKIPVLEELIKFDNNNAIRPKLLTSEFYSLADISADDIANIQNPKVKEWVFYNTTLLIHKYMNENKQMRLLQGVIGEIVQKLYNQNPAIYGDVLKSQKLDTPERESNSLISMANLNRPLFENIIKTDPLKYWTIIKELHKDKDALQDRIAEEVFKSSHTEEDAALKAQKLMEYIYHTIRSNTSAAERDEIEAITDKTPANYDSIMKKEVGPISDTTAYKKAVDALSYLIKGYPEIEAPEPAVDIDIEDRINNTRTQLESKGVPSDRIDMILDKLRKKTEADMAKESGRGDLQKERWEAARGELSEMLDSQSITSSEELQATEDMLGETALAAADAEKAIVTFLKKNKKKAPKKTKEKKAVRRYGIGNITEAIKSGDLSKLDTYFDDEVGSTKLKPEFTKLVTKAVVAHKQLNKINAYLEESKKSGKMGYVTSEQLEKIVTKMLGKSNIDSDIKQIIYSESEWDENELKVLVGEAELKALKSERPKGKFKSFPHGFKVSKQDGLVHPTLKNPNGFSMYMTFDEKELPDSIKNDAGVMNEAKRPDHFKGVNNVVGWTAATPFTYEIKTKDGIVKQRALYLHEMQSDMVANIKTQAQQDNYNKIHGAKKKFNITENAQAIQNYFTDWYKVLLNHSIKLAKSEGYDSLWIASADMVAKKWSGQDASAWKQIYDETPKNLGAKRLNLANDIPWMGDKLKGNNEVWAIDLKTIPRNKIAVVLSSRR